jgi:hypothetical protein
MVLGRQRKQWSACEEASAGCMVIGEVWVDPLRHRARRGTDDEKSRQGGFGFLEHGFEYSNWMFAVRVDCLVLFEVTERSSELSCSRGMRVAAQCQLRVRHTSSQDA